MKIGCQIYTSEILPYMRVVKNVTHNKKKTTMAIFRQEVVVTVLLCSNALGRTALKVSL